MRFMQLMNESRIVVPPREGRAVSLRRGQQVRLEDVEGGQVGDVFAFSAEDITEFHSASHTRAHNSRLFPRVGEPFLTNRRRPILTLVADTSPGIHDMLIAACDPARYAALGASEHASCAENLRSALADIGLATPVVPQPINIFMRIPVAENGGLSWLSAPTRGGEAITFEATMDCVLVLSACPQDLTAINGKNPTALAIDLLADAGTETPTND
ncbi:urea carboxylase-associated family protein [Rhodococcus wratislaviensis]|nr:urea carboxylase-associated family protein [Rhodococcus sp. 3A]MBC2894515.1 urea carboxylase-associated family protein [Rhodococcus sp. 4CII]